MFGCRLRLQFLCFVFSLTAVALPFRTARADIAIVDQQNLNNEGLMASPSLAFSQSFLPSLSSLDTVDVILWGPASADLKYLQLDLFQGGGIGGTLLGTAAMMPLAAGSGPIVVEFKLWQTVFVQPGTLYTFFVYCSDQIPFSAQYGSDTYAGGNMFDATYYYPDRDLYFREGLSVPEPSTAALLAVTTLATAVFVIRRESRPNRD